MSKKLGQHFLINQEAIKKIVSALDLKKGEMVVEIGPGHGELTEELIKHPVNLIAVEKDRELAEKLKEKFKGQSASRRTNVKIIDSDILKILPKTADELKKGYKLVGNIPYYLTGYLLRIIGELENKPRLIVFTIQKEVAERIAAKKGKMNLLAASVQFWAEPEIIETLPASDFNPPPKVKSAVIRLTPKKSFDSAQGKNYFDFIKILFKQPRKTILNNLADGLGLEKSEVKIILKKLKVKEDDRPQDLDIKTIGDAALKAHLFSVFLPE